MKHISDGAFVLSILGSSIYFCSLLVRILPRLIIAPCFSCLEQLHEYRYVWDGAVSPKDKSYMVLLGWCAEMACQKESFGILAPHFLHSGCQGWGLRCVYPAMSSDGLILVVWVESLCITCFLSSHLLSWPLFFLLCLSININRPPLYLSSL